MADHAVGQGDWCPTHEVPAGGMRAWSVPDGSTQSVVTLPAGLQVMVIETQDEWTQVRAENGWTGWVDGSWLGPVAMAEESPPAPADEAAAVVRAGLNAALDRCLDALERFGRGELTEDQLQDEAIEAGIVHAGGVAWILDWEHGEWLRYDGFTLRPLAEVSDQETPS